MSDSPPPPLCAKYTRCASLARRRNPTKRPFRHLPVTRELFSREIGIFRRANFHLRAIPICRIVNPTREKFFQFINLRHKSVSGIGDNDAKEKCRKYKESIRRHVEKVKLETVM